MTLGKRIQRARKRLDLTQDQVAKDMGVSKQAVSNWERDKDQPEGNRFADLRSVLKVTYKWLFEGTGDPPEPDAPGVLLEALTEQEQAEAVAFIQFRRQQGGKAA